MQVKERQDLLQGDPRHVEVRAEAIVEPAVWIPDVPGDDPEMDYTRWRDLLFVHSGSADSLMRGEA